MEGHGIFRKWQMALCGWHEGEGSEGHKTDEIDRGPHCEGPQVRCCFPCSSALPSSLPSPRISPSGSRVLRGIWPLYSSPAQSSSMLSSEVPRGALQDIDIFRTTRAEGAIDKIALLCVWAPVFLPPCARQLEIYTPVS